MYGNYGRQTGRVGQLRIKKLDLFGSGTFQQQFKRSYITSVDSDVLEQLQSRTRNGSNLHSESLSRVAGSIMRPSAEISGRAVIDNGWDCPRFRFVLEIELPVSGTTALRRIFTGWTDHGEIDSRGNIGDDMILSVNNAVTLRDRLERGPTGERVVTNQVNNDQLLVSDCRGYRQRRSGTEWSLRPTDVFTSAAAGSLLREMEMGDQHASDNTSGINNGVALNTRRNLNASSYLNRLLKARKDAEMTDDQYLGAEIDTHGRAASIVDESTLEEDAIMSAFSRVSDFAESGEITIMQLHDLCDYLPEVVEVWDATDGYMSPGLTRGNDMPDHNNSDHLGGSDPETIAAETIHATVAGMMTDELVYYTNFTITNDTRSGETEIFTRDQPYTKIEGLDVIEQYERFMTRFRNEMAYILTENNMRSITADVVCDACGSTTVSISLEGGPFYQYTKPTFSDRTNSLIVTNDENRRGDIVSDLTNLSENFDLGRFQERTTEYRSAPRGRTSNNEGIKW